MKILFIALIASVLLSGFIPQLQTKRNAYKWIILENIPRDNMGYVTGPPSWDAPLRIHSPTPATDTFEIFENNDSILMITPDIIGHRMFRKVQINASKWKPRLNYGNKLFLLGTYETNDLSGMYFSYYSTKDGSCLMSIDYSNPGNMGMPILFTKEPVNILAKSGILIDPRDEKSEPERIQMKKQTMKVH